MASLCFQGQDGRCLGRGRRKWGKVLGKARREGKHAWADEEGWGMDSEA